MAVVRAGGSRGASPEQSRAEATATGESAARSSLPALRGLARARGGPWQPRTGLAPVRLALTRVRLDLAGCVRDRKLISAS